MARIGVVDHDRYNSVFVPDGGRCPFDAFVLLSYFFVPDESIPVFFSGGSVYASVYTGDETDSDVSSSGSRSS